MAQKPLPVFLNTLGYGQLLLQLNIYTRSGEPPIAVAGLIDSGAGSRAYVHESFVEQHALTQYRLPFDLDVRNVDGSPNVAGPNYYLQDTEADDGVNHTDVELFPVTLAVEDADPTLNALADPDFPKPEAGAAGSLLLPMPRLHPTGARRIPSSRITIGSMAPSCRAKLA
ncbi:hypothetical protein DFP72DRAFT_1070365 [Ephemerocybe angulata]|uniref:Uncharacterized protein n=1 Tax=Ephemerocybe angulata TaxID=980116 RepID=A0A8H6M1V5_9AGAR|nr:hypothetical protein DFP72DRAFT_1070365 [Tulosesus angulatus]